MYAWTRPQVLVPVHGEAMHLAAQARLARCAGIPQVAQVRNGDLLRLAPGPAEIIDDIPFGRIYKDGKLIGNEDEVGVSERRKLSFAGSLSLFDRASTATGAWPTKSTSHCTACRKRRLGRIVRRRAVRCGIGAIESIPPGRRKDEELVMRAGGKSAARRRARPLGQEAGGHVFVAKV